MKLPRLRQLCGHGKTCPIWEAAQFIRKTRALLPGGTGANCVRAGKRDNGLLKNIGPVDLNYVGSASSFRIGSSVCCGEYLAGIVDEPSLYNRALTADEVFGLYDAGSSGKCGGGPPPLMAIAAGSGRVYQISWPASATAFMLESSGSVLGPWTNFATGTLQGDRWIAPINATNKVQFFRLKR